MIHKEFTGKPQYQYLAVQLITILFTIYDFVSFVLFLLTTIIILYTILFCFVCMFVYFLFCRWPRPSGSDSDTDDDQHAGHQQAPVRSVSTVGPPSGGHNQITDPRTGVRPHPLAAHHNSTPSPQLSLAEFLQDE